MRKFVIVAISLAGVISLLDVAAAFMINGSINIPRLLILVVVGAWLVQLVTKDRVVDPRDLATLVRLHHHVEALARHVEVLSKRGIPRYHRDLAD